MHGPLSNNKNQEQEKEIVSILIDSALYLDMDLAERCRLLHFIEESYFESAGKQ
jgi:hypothetical protein